MKRSCAPSPACAKRSSCARDDGADKRLVAYVVSDAPLEVAALRSRLAAELPEHMLPSAFVALAAFPLTPNGKLDRAALPAPDATAVLTRTFAAPQGPIESAIATLWCDLLGLDRVGRHDHFFELGGHSLMVVTLIERLRQQGLVADVRAIFAAPVLADLAAAIGSAAPTQRIDVPPNRITPECTAITPDLLPLVSLTQAEIDGLIAAVPGGVTNIQDIYPLAPLQEGILFHHLLQHEGDAYLLRSLIAFDTRDRLDTFLAALQAVIDRHDILRTAVHWHGVSTPVQVVQRRAPLPVVELAVDGDVRTALLARTDPRHVRMDLTRAPLLAATIALDAASGEWLMALLSHHLIDDNYTLQLILAEVQALLEGRGAMLPAPLPYRAFIAQVRQVPAAVHEAYFRAQLADVDAPTAPFGVLDAQAHIQQTIVPLDEALAAQIRQTARQRGVTPAVLFHAAFAVMLARLGERDTVVFGTTVSGRLQGSAGADRVLGMFINTLPIRLDVDGAVHALIEQTYARLSGLLAHEQAPLALAQRCSAVAAPLPLFTSLLNYRHTQVVAGAQVDWPGMRLLHGEERTTYPLTVSIDDRGEGFTVVAQGVEGIDPERVAAYLMTALRGLLGAGDTAVNTLSILPASERQQLLEDFNATAVVWPEAGLVHTPIERQAAATPDAVAVICEGQSLTYAELNRRANRLAHRLIALGVTPDTRVAICLERRFELVVGLLAILKAGGAYVPLDPSYPAERLAYMLEDSAPMALLTQAALCDRLPAPTLPTLVLDDQATAAALAQYPDRDIDTRTIGLTPHHLAYVIYTSGSTGKPKGVAIEHDGVVKRLLWAQSEYRLNHNDRVLQKTPIRSIFPSGSSSCR